MVTMDDVTAQSLPMGLEVRLRCPLCTAPLLGFSCERCDFALRQEDGVWIAMSEERIAHYAPFTRDYAHIRAAQGRGSANADFYLNLPYKDTLGINSAQWSIRARTFDFLTKQLLKAPAKPEMRRILDVGAGNGWMSFRLALRGYAPVAVDLLTNSDDGLGAALHYRAALPRLFPRFQAEYTHLPFEDGQFDAVIFNASFHYSEDYSLTLREALRCVRTGGLVIISDTPWYSHDKSGRRMIAERQALYRRQYGTASDSLRSLEYLTDERLETLEREFSIRWSVFAPWYGFKWATRPLVATLRGRREPSRFRIYVTQKNA